MIFTYNNAVNHFLFNQLFFTSMLAGVIDEKMLFCTCKAAIEKAAAKKRVF